MDYNEEDGEYFFEEIEEESKVEQITLLAKYQRVEEESVCGLLMDLSYKISTIAKEAHVDHGSALEECLKCHLDLEVAIKNLKAVATAQEKSSLPAISKGIECPSCLCLLDLKQMKILDCTHFICNECLYSYIRESIRQGPTSVLTKCPQEGCKKKLSYLLILEYTDKQTRQMFEKFLIDTAVQNSKNLLFCPASRCDGLLKVSGIFSKFKAEQEDITCCIDKCHFCFCILCKKEGHWPLKCEQATDWWNKFASSDEAATELWMIFNTKPCPKCKSSIEKNLGCMHMTCTSCKHEFCWLCMGNWRNHSNCNNFSKDSGLDDIKKDLERTKFYTERYLEHKRSVKISEDQSRNKLDELDSILAQMKAKIDPKERENFKLNLELVTKTRRIIAHTYAFAFYMVNESNRIFFQFLQNDLEGNLEKLNKISDYPMTNFESFSELSRHLFEVNKLADVLRPYATNIITELKNNLPDLMLLTNSKSGSGGSNSQSKQWSCLDCTYLNSYGSSVCAMCDGDRVYFDFS